MVVNAWVPMFRLIGFYWFFFFIIIFFMVPINDLALTNMALH
jgi:hypothetical protein